MNSKDIGDRSEALITAALLKKGYVVLKPFGDNQRYDLVVDHNGEFIRIQCKTGRYKNGSIMIDACSSYYHRGEKKKNYRGQIEKFGVYCPYNDKVYLIPVDSVGLTAFILRVDFPKNNQRNKIRWAKDYEIN